MRESADWEKTAALLFVRVQVSHSDACVRSGAKPKLPGAEDGGCKMLWVSISASPLSLCAIAGNSVGEVASLSPPLKWVSEEDGPQSGTKVSQRVSTLHSIHGKWN